MKNRIVRIAVADWGMGACALSYFGPITAKNKRMSSYLQTGEPPLNCINPVYQITIVHPFEIAIRNPDYHIAIRFKASGIGLVPNSWLYYINHKIYRRVTWGDIGVDRKEGLKSRAGGKVNHFIAEVDDSAMAIPCFVFFGDEPVKIETVEQLKIHIAKYGMAQIGEENDAI